MMAYAGAEAQIHSNIKSVIGRDESSVSRSGCFIPMEKGSCSHRVGGYVGPSASLDISEKKGKPFHGRKQN